MKCKVDEHLIEVDRGIRTLVLKIDGKVVDKVNGIGKIFNERITLRGQIKKNASESKEIVAIIENNSIATIITITIDGQQVSNGILI